MIRATLTMQVRAGSEAAFEREWQKVAEVTRGAPGNLRQALLRSTEDPSMFVVTSDWTDREAFGAFERSPAQDELTAPLRSLRESASMRVDELLAHVDADS